jgi:hypothetical protein
MITNAELQKQVIELRELVTQLQQAPSEPSEAPSLTPTPAMRREPKLPEPPEFDGKPPDYATFINHCDLYFRMRPVTFDSDYVKVAYVISRCRHAPAEWGHSLIESSSNLLHDYKAFKEQMASMYADKQRRKTLRRKLTMLKQTGSAAKFASEFLTIANILGIDDESRFALFTNGLKPEVQRALAISRDIDRFEDLVDAAVQIDHVNFTLAKAEAKAESKSSGKPSSSQGKGPPPSTSSSFRPQQPRTDNIASITPNHSRPFSKNPSTSHNPISQEEKERREAMGLCRFCGGTHFKRDCPSLKAKVEKEGSKGPPPRYPTPSTSNVNSDATHVTVPHVISGKFQPQSQ